MNKALFPGLGPGESALSTVVGQLLVKIIGRGREVPFPSAMVKTQALSLHDPVDDASGIAENSNVWFAIGHDCHLLSG